MPRSSRFALLALLAVSAACSSSGGGTEPGPTPTIALSLGASNATVTQGGSTPVTATLTRGGGYGGTVALTVEGAPAGVTGAVSGMVTSGTTTTGTVTISVAASVASGSYALTVTGTGSGVSAATAPFTLTVTAAPAYTLTLSSGTLSLVQGTNDVVTVTIGRTNYSGAVTLALEGAPTGVTGVFAPPSPTGTTSVLTVSAAALVTPGQYPLTVRGTGAASLVTEGASAAITDQTVPLLLTVTAAPSYALSLDLPTLSVTQGGQGQRTVTITRTNFAGAVTLGLTGLPSGVTFDFNPASTTANTSTLTISAGAGVVPGVFPLSVTGTASAGNQNTPLTLTVTQAQPSGNVAVSFAECPGPDKAVWLAFQDGNGTWTRVTGSADVYSFTVNQSRGGFAYASAPGFGSSVTVQYRTRAELSAATIHVCVALSGKTVTATATDQASGTLGLAGLGGSQTLIAGTGAITWLNVPDGAVDLVALSRVFGTFGSGDRYYIDRGLNPPNGGSLGTLSFTGPKAFAAVPVAMSVSGLGAGETLNRGLTYLTGPACQAAQLGGQVNSPTTFQQYGVPAGQQQPGDLHRLLVLGSGTDYTRIATEDFHLLAPRTLVLPATPPAILPTVPAGPYKRLSVVLAGLPAELNGLSSMFYSDEAGNGHRTMITATAGWQTGGTVTLAMPDFSSVSGWSNSFAAPAGASVFSVTLSGANATTACGEGLRSVSVSRTGTA